MIVKNMKKPMTLNVVMESITDEYKNVPMVISIEDFEGILVPCEISGCRYADTGEKYVMITIDHKAFSQMLAYNYKLKYGHTPDSENIQ